MRSIGTSNSYAVSNTNQKSSASSNRPPTWFGINVPMKPSSVTQRLSSAARAVHWEESKPSKAIAVHANSLSEPIVGLLADVKGRFIK